MNIFEKLKRFRLCERGTSEVIPHNKKIASLSFAMTKRNKMNVIKEIEITNYPQNNTPTIRVFDDGTSYLLIDNVEDFFAQNLDEELTELLEVEVEQEDRERFIIMTNNLDKIEQLKVYLENYQLDISNENKWLKAKEIDNIIYEKLGAFLKEQKSGFKQIKKRRGFVKKINGISFYLTFYYCDYGTFTYDFILGIHIQEIHDIINKVENREEFIGKFDAYTSILPFTFFTNDDIRRNKRWEDIAYEEEVDKMIDEVQEYYLQYISDFIEQNSTYERILELINNQIDTDRFFDCTSYTNRFQKCVILMKLIQSKNYNTRVKELRNLLAKLEKRRVDASVEEFDKVVEYLDKNYC